MKSNLFFIGIDGGGTKCRARLEDSNGMLIGEGISGPANIMRDSALAQRSMVEAIEKAVAASRLSIGKEQCVVGAGLAGANIAQAAVQFSDWSHPFHQMHVLSDLHAACLGAHNGQEGAAIITGTGSSATCWNNGEFTDIGGHGFPIGDVASGAWLGLKAVQHTLLCLDGLRPVDELSATICKALHTQNANDIVSECATFNTHHFAALVEQMLPLLYMSVDSVVSLFTEGANYLDRVANVLLANNDCSLAMIGGLSTIYSQHLSSPIQARTVSSKSSPQQGALFFAKTRYSDLESLKLTGEQ
ncbi:BadF/BadG/BcrA/BcrD ATPase family protein [Alteromonas sp. P256]|uniref:BadF/BadG/BcrA/BcrD ATPase family protein n=1 Tax=Alteromonas sp. P256 TaxID=3117399 RepID=UPI002FE334E9